MGLKNKMVTLRYAISMTWITVVLVTLLRDYGAGTINWISTLTSVGMLLVAYLYLEFVGYFNE